MTDDLDDYAGPWRSLGDGGTRYPDPRKERIRAKALILGLEAEEVAMLRQMVAGWSNKEMATALGLDALQFEEIRRRMMTKLNAESTTKAVRIGIYADLG